MILQEMDPILAREQFVPLLQNVLTNLEQDTITTQEAIASIQEIETDIVVVAALSTTSTQDRY